MKDSLNVHIDKVEELNKQLSEVKKQKETAKSKCLEFVTTTSILVRDVEQAQDLNETLKKSLQDTQFYQLSADDKYFERAKAQVLCITPDLNVSELDFFKTVVDGRLVDMKEVSPEDGVLKDAQPTIKPLISRR